MRFAIATIVNEDQSVTTGLIESTSLLDQEVYVINENLNSDLVEDILANPLGFYVDNGVLYQRGNPDVVVVLANPNPPANLVIQSTRGGIALTFDPSNSLGVVRYEVHASTESGFTPIQSNLVSSGENTRHEISDLVGGQTYYFKVRSVDIANQKSTFADIDGVAGLVRGQDLTNFAHLWLADDFTRMFPDVTKWDISETDSIIEGDGDILRLSLLITSNSGTQFAEINSYDGLSTNKAVILTKMRAKFESGVSGEFRIGCRVNIGTGFDTIEDFFARGTNAGTVKCVSLGASMTLEETDNITMDFTEFHEYKVEKSSTYTKFYIDNELVATHSTVVNQGVFGVKIIVSRSANKTTQTYKGYIDWVIQQYAE